MAVQAGDILRVAAQMTAGAGQAIVNIWMLHVLGLGSTTDDGEFMDELADSLWVEFYQTIAGFIANNVTGELLTGVNLTKNEVLPPVAFPMAGAGSATDAMPRQVTALIALNGDEPRRQGRIYLPPFIESSMNDDGAWEAARVSDLVTLSLVLLNPIPGATISTERIVSNAAGSSWFVPTAAVVPVSPRTQRRRTPGRGA